MSYDTLIHYAERPAIRVAAARTRVTPEHLAALRGVASLGAAVVLASAGVLAPTAALLGCLTGLPDRHRRGMVASPLPQSRAGAMGSAANRDWSLAEHR